MGGYVYIMASKRHGTLYIGVTSNLVQRVWQHREGVLPGFTTAYDVKLLVHYEHFGDIQDAIQREKNLKHWVRRWKISLIEESNPHWADLWPSIARWGPV